MTVGELRKALEGVPDNLEVYHFLFPDHEPVEEVYVYRDAKGNEQLRID